MVLVQDQAEQVAEGFCGGLGSLSKACADMVETYFPRLWHELMTGAQVRVEVWEE